MSTMEQTIAVLGAAGYQAWSNAMSGSTPALKAYYERVMNPRPGDIVVETSSFGVRERDGRAHTAVGVLVERVSETVPYDDHEPGEEPEHYTEKVWYVTPYLGGDAVRWTDAHFVALPATARQGREWLEPADRRFLTRR